MRLRLRAAYEGMAFMNQRCWRANCNSFVHAWCVVGMLGASFASDSELRELHMLHPHYSAPGYIALCISLGYCCFAIPWSYRIHFFEKKNDVVPFGMVVHHACLLVGCLVYLLGLVCAPYGAIAFGCMELTNCFYVPHILAEQVQHDGSLLMTINDALLAIFYIGCRIVICSWVGILFVFELADVHTESSLEGAFIITAFTIYASVLLLSWIWFPRVLRELKRGLAELGFQLSCLAPRRMAPDKDNLERRCCKMDNCCQRSRTCCCSWWPPITNRRVHVIDA